MIKISPSLLRDVYDHMETTYPHECCGLLIGSMSAEAKTVHAVRRCKNLNTERAADRYDMDPLCQLRAEREFADSPWDIIGIYHSHPDHPSRPSQTDTDRAFTAYSYIIVSVAKGKIASAQSWVLNEGMSAEEKRFDEEPLVVEGDQQ